MNNESEAVEQFLQWLLKDSQPTGLAPSGKIASHGTELDELAEGNPAFNHFDPLDSEEFGTEPSQPESGRFLFEHAAFEFGDKPTVQDRFYTVIKRRLRVESERNPPRFPWETGAYRYEAEAPDVSIWTTQLQALNLPIALPEPVLSRLFEQCQTVVQSSLREGAKLVQAVELLFPGETQTLNQLAAIVLASPARGTVPTVQGTVPNQYEEASPTQQMALSLLAARTILESLSLTVAADRPVSRQWLTSVGAVVLEASYDAVTQRLQIHAQLPIAGSVRLQNSRTQTSAQRDSAGLVSVALLNPNDQPYQLEVTLAEAEPLYFAVRVVSA